MSVQDINLPDFRVNTGFSVVNSLLVPQVLFTSLVPNTLGFATGASSFQGSARIVRGIELLKRAWHAKDSFGKGEGLREIIGGGLEFLGGSGYLGSHIAALMARVRGATNHIQAYGRAIVYSKIAGNCFFILSMAAATIINIWHLVKTVVFCKEAKDSSTSIENWFGWISKKMPLDLPRVTDDAYAASVARAKERGLQQRLVQNDGKVKDAAIKEAQALKTQMVDANWTRIKHLGLAIVLTLGVCAVLAALTFAALPLGGMLALAGLLVLLSLTQALVDFYILHTSDAKLASSDKKYHKAMIVCVLICLIISSAVTLGCGFAPMLLIFPLILSAVAIGVSGASLWRLGCNEELFKKNHPDLKTFLEELENSPTINEKGKDEKGKEGKGKHVDVRIQRLFKGLSQKDKEDIRAKFVEEPPKLRDKILSKNKKPHINTSEFILCEQALTHMTKKHWKEEDAREALQVQKALDNLSCTCESLQPSEFKDALFDKFMKEVAYLTYRFEDETKLRDAVKNILESQEEK